MAHAASCRTSTSSTPAPPSAAAAAVLSPGAGGALAGAGAAAGISGGQTRACTQEQASVSTGGGVPASCSSCTSVAAAPSRARNCGAIRANAERQQGAHPRW